MIKDVFVGFMSGLAPDYASGEDPDYTAIDIEMHAPLVDAPGGRRQGDDAREAWVRHRDQLTPIFDTEREYAVYIHARACAYAGIHPGDPAGQLRRRHFLQGVIELENYDGDMDDIVVDHVMSAYHPIARQIRNANIANPGAYPETSRLRLYVGGQDVVCYREEFVDIAVDFMMRLVGTDYALATVLEDEEDPPHSAVPPAEPGGRQNEGEEGEYPPAQPHPTAAKPHQTKKGD